MNEKEELKEMLNKIAEISNPTLICCSQPGPAFVLWFYQIYEINVSSSQPLVSLTSLLLWSHQSAWNFLGLIQIVTVEIRSSQIKTVQRSSCGRRSIYQKFQIIWSKIDKSQAQSTLWVNWIERSHLLQIRILKKCKIFKFGPKSVWQNVRFSYLVQCQFGKM